MALLRIKTAPLRLLTTGTALLISAGVLAGCGGSSSQSGTPAQSDTPATSESASGGSSDLNALLPADIRERGYITAAGDASYPPIGSMDTDGKTMIGVDPDFAKALGEKLGIEIRMVNASFDSIVPGIAGRKYDAGMSWINDTPERQKVVDFVDYSADGSSMFVPAGAAKKPATLDDLCGMKVAVQKGSVQQSDVEGQNTKCTDAGKSAIDVQVYPDQIACNLALSSGRAEVTIADTPVAAWQVDESGGKFELSGDAYGKVNHGVALPKDSGLAEPIAKAFQAIIADGTYAEILEHWGMSAAAIPAPLINGQPVSS